MLNRVSMLHHRLTDRSLLAQTFIRGAACLAAIAGLYLLSRLVKMPGTLEGAWLDRVGRHGGWRMFLCVHIPLALFMLSTLQAWLSVWSRRLNSPGSGPAPWRLSAGDRINLAALVLIAGFMALRSLLTEYLILCSAAYLAALGANAWLLAREYWLAAGAAQDQSGQTGQVDLRLGWLMALGGSLLYACLALWTVQAIGTAGDEPHYLVRAHALLNKLGLIQGTGVEPEVRSAFYWGHWSKNLFSGKMIEPLFILSTTPFYLAAGRWGALLLISLCGGAGLAGLYFAARKMGYSGRDALLACGLLWVCPAYMIFSQHVYPELPGATLTIWGVNVLLGGGRPLVRGVALLMVATVLALCKLRLAPLGLGLLTAFVLKELIWIRISRFGWRILSIAGILGLLLLALGLLPILRPYYIAWLSHSMPELYAYVKIMPSIFSLPLLSTFPALLLDQEYGIFWYAPWLCLSLAAFFMTWGQSRNQLSLVFTVCAMTTIITVYWRWLQWDAGFTPPGRFLTAQLPLYALFILPCLRLRHNKAVKTLLAGLALWAVAYGYVLNLNPMWRYHRRLGISHILAWWNQTFDTVVNRFFPSFISYYLADMLPAVWMILALAGLGLWLRLVQAKAPPKSPAGEGGGRRPVAVLALAAILLAIGLSLAGRWLPTYSLAPATFTRQGSRVHGGLYPWPMLLLFNQKGEKAQTGLVWGPGMKTLLIRATHHLVGQREKKRPFAPVLGVYLDGKRVGKISLNKKGKQLYALRLKSTWGIHRLGLQYLKKPWKDQITIERIEIR